jgi:alkylhydroperoxidase family enzyme
LNQAGYEWAQHVEIAKRTGISAEEIERVKLGPSADWNSQDAALLQSVDDLYEHSVVSDATWEALAAKYSVMQMMDLVFTIGQYNLVSWALNSFGVPLDDFLPGAEK